MAHDEHTPHTAHTANTAADVDALVSRTLRSAGGDMRVGDSDEPKSPFAQRRARTLRAYMAQELDPARATAPLTAYCFMTGFMDAITFSTVSVWCAFQTGNTIELALAFARLLSDLAAAPRNPVPITPVVPTAWADAPATAPLLAPHTLTSLLAFLLGGLLSRIGDSALFALPHPHPARTDTPAPPKPPAPPRTRAWLVAGTLLQAAMTLAAALAVWWGVSVDASSAPYSAYGPRAHVWSTWHGYAALALASASMGLQGTMGKKMGTAFATTVVLTSVWLDLLSSPLPKRPFRTPAPAPAPTHRRLSIPRTDTYTLPPPGSHAPKRTFLTPLRALLTLLLTPLRTLLTPLRTLLTPLSLLASPRPLAIAALFVGGVVGRLALVRCGVVGALVGAAVVRAGVAVAWGVV